MGYQRNTKQVLAWRKWINENQQVLINTCGISLQVLASQDNWYEFLNHAYFATDEGIVLIDVDDMPIDKARNLWQFLKQKEVCDCYLMRILKDIVTPRQGGN